MNDSYLAIVSAGKSAKKCLSKLPAFASLLSAWPACLAAASLARCGARSGARCAALALQLVPPVEPVRLAWRFPRFEPPYWPAFTFFLDGSEVNLLGEPHGLFRPVTSVTSRLPHFPCLSVFLSVCLFFLTHEFLHPLVCQCFYRI